MIIEVFSLIKKNLNNVQSNKLKKIWSNFDHKTIPNINNNNYYYYFIYSYMVQFYIEVIIFLIECSLHQTIND